MFEHGTLLIVDDEPANLQKLRRTFIEDFQILEAESGQKALELLNQHTCSVIITDQRMPDISGVELLKSSLRTNPRAVRIILTGYTEVEDLISAINEGQVDRYVTKPWDPFSLRQSVLRELELGKLKRENAVLTEQIRIAKEVQSMLFPQLLPQVPNLEYCGYCRPAREIGGDYYDFLQMEPSRLWLTVGDISGKGISAALLMANLQGLFRSHAGLYGDSVEQLVTEVNRFLHETTGATKFASLFCGLFDATTRSMHYVNAGHCAPMLIRSGENGLDFQDLAPTGTIVGMFPDITFENRTITMRPGDLLLIYTDGVTEAFDDSSHLFGEERLREVLSQNFGSPVDKLSETILRKVLEFSGGVQHDDLTVVAARVK